MTFIKLARRALVPSALICFVLLAPQASAQSVERDYLPFAESRLRRFPLKRTELTREGLMSEGGVNVSGVKIREEEEPGARGGAAGAEEEDAARFLVFSGRDLGGREWRVTTGTGVYYEAVYEGDLDRNGQRDLVVSIGTGGNGLAPPTRLVFLTFDRARRPTLFNATGYFESRPGDIFDVTDFDGDGRAELLYMNYGDGYWITNLYRMRDSRWSRVEGRFAGLNFPLYTRFTRRPNHRPVRPARGRNPVAPDLIKENAER
ncbi:MAG TPA: hypothetical protein VFS10_07640 [Pyrinomonadaceae bacterium]|nr:hypothetical protein [Pyrinomonadaceae bacterium]